MAWYEVLDVAAFPIGFLIGVGVWWAAGPVWGLVSAGTSWLVLFSLVEMWPRKIK